MFGSTILDVAIGIVFVFLLVSLIASAVREGLEGWLKTRAAHLEAGLREVLRDPDGTGLVTQFYNHPLIYSLYSGEYEAKAKRKHLMFARGANLPSYIPSRSFALALMDMAARGPQVTSGPTSPAPVTLDGIRANVGTIENAAVRRALLIAVDGAEGDIRTAQANLEAWYNSAMDRVSGWYKRSSQAILLVFGLILAISMNVNAIKIGDRLYHDSALRQKAVQSAEAEAAEKNHKPGDEDGFPIGWPGGFQGAREDFETNWVTYTAGWMLTAFAVSFGAPFWFDLLNRLIVIRSTVKPHQKSPEEASADRQSPSLEPARPTANQSTSGTAPSAGKPGADGHYAVDVDGCDVDMANDITADELLPAAVGGVS